jgi:hypothetical protein
MSGIIHASAGRAASFGWRAQGQKLSGREQRELEYKRQVYELAKLRKAQQEELDARDEYHMPAAYDAEGGQRGSRYDVLTARYRCAAQLCLSRHCMASWPR